MADISLVTVELDPSVQRTMLTAASALVAAELDESLRAVLCRVMTPGHLLAVESTGGKMAQVRVGLSPYAELALLEIAGIAQSQSAQAVKALRIEQVLVMSGF